MSLERKIGSDRSAMTDVETQIIIVESVSSKITFNYLLKLFQEASRIDLGTS